MKIVVIVVVVVGVTLYVTSDKYKILYTLLVHHIQYHTAGNSR